MRRLFYRSRKPLFIAAPAAATAGLEGPSDEEMAHQAEAICGVQTAVAVLRMGKPLRLILSGGLVAPLIRRRRLLHKLDPKLGAKLMAASQPARAMTVEWRHK